MSPLPEKTLIVNVVSIKGGAGKSVLALALSLWLARTKKRDIGRVLYLDTDFSGTCTRDGIGEKQFARDTARGMPFRFLEELIGRIGPSRTKEKPAEFFECFPDGDLKERLWLAFSAQDHQAARRLSHFLDVERYTDLIMHRLLDLCGRALRDVSKKSVVIVDNGPGIYGLALSLLDPQRHLDLDRSVRERRITPPGKNLQIAHLLVTTPDRQDLEGMRKLLEEEQKLRTSALEGLTIPDRFDYLLVLNMSRKEVGSGLVKKMNESFFPKIKDLELDELLAAVIEDELTDEVKEQWREVLATCHGFRDFTEVKNRFKALGDHPWLRLFDPFGVPLWERWDEHSEEIGGIFEGWFEAMAPGFLGTGP